MIKCLVNLVLASLLISQTTGATGPKRRPLKRTYNVDPTFSRWPDKAAIPYYLDPVYTATEQGIIRAGLAKFISDMVGCLNFVEVSQADPRYKIFITPFNDLGVRQTFCYTFPGRHNQMFNAGQKQQRMVITGGPNGCLDGSLRSIMKYFAMVVGRRNEHQRGDRDTYLNVNLVNVAVPNSYRLFNTSEAYWATFPYDYCSITHNQPTDYAVPGSVVFSVRTGPNAIPKLDLLSNTDCQLISMIYQCPTTSCLLFSCGAARFVAAAPTTTTTRAVVVTTTTRAPTTSTTTVPTTSTTRPTTTTTAPTTTTTRPLTTTTTPPTTTTTTVATTTTTTTPATTTTTPATTTTTRPTTTTTTPATTTTTTPTTTTTRPTTTTPATTTTRPTTTTTTPTTTTTTRPTTTTPAPTTTTTRPTTTTTVPTTTTTRPTTTTPAPTTTTTRPTTTTTTAPTTTTTRPTTTTTAPTTTTTRPTTTTTTPTTTRTTTTTPTTTTTRPTTTTTVTTTTTTPQLCPSNYFCTRSPDESIFYTGPYISDQVFLLFSGPCVMQWTMNYAAAQPPITPSTVQPITTFFPSPGGPTAVTPVDFGYMALNFFTGGYDITLLNKPGSRSLTCSVNPGAPVGATCPAASAADSKGAAGTSTAAALYIADFTVHHYVIDTTGTRIALMDSTLTTIEQPFTDFLTGQTVITKITAVQLIMDMATAANPTMMAVFGTAADGTPYVGFVREASDWAANPSSALGPFTWMGAPTRMNLATAGC